MKIIEAAVSIQESTVTENNFVKYVQTYDKYIQKTTSKIMIRCVVVREFLQVSVQS